MGRLKRNTNSISVYTLDSVLNYNWGEIEKYLESLNTGLLNLIPLSNEQKKEMIDLLNNAQKVNAENKDVQQQINNLILAEGQSEAEVIQARGEFTVLNERLNNIESLNDYNKDLIGISSFAKKGLIVYPADFKKVLPFQLFIDEQGNIKHDFSFSNLFSQSTKTIYWDWVNGVTTYDGLTAGQPTKRFDKVVEAINSISAETVTVEIANSIVPYTEFNNVFGATLNKNVILKPKSGIDNVTITSARDTTTFSWSKTGNVYKTARSSVVGVIDAKIKDFKGMPKEYRKLDNLTDVQNVPGSYYTDNVDVYINTFDGRQPDKDVAMLLPMGYEFKFDLADKMLFLDRVSFVFNSTVGNALRVEGVKNSRFIAKESTFALGKINGLSTYKVGDVYTFNCQAYGNGADGFNYHGVNGTSPYEFVFEYYDYSHHNGHLVAGTGNATTAHDGITILRVVSVGHDTNGPVLADVNGCYSLNYNCTMYNSLRESTRTKAGYYFDKTNAQRSDAKVYLIDCAGGGVDTMTVNTDGLVDLYIDNLQGNNVPADLKYELI